MEKATCFCNANRETFIFKVKEKVRGQTFNIVRCKNCGLVYVNPRPAQKQISAYYEKEYAPHVFAQREKKRLLARLVDAYVRLFGEDPWSFKGLRGHVLDIGCGSGYFDRQLVRQGFDVYGIEVDKRAARLAKKQGVKVFVGTIEKMSSRFAKGFFDVIIMRHSIEHLHDPVRAVRIAKTWLNRKGILIIGTPNFECFERKIFGKHWFGLQVPKHLYLFSPATLAKLLESQGFQARVVFEPAPTTLVNTLINGDRHPKPAQLLGCALYPVSFFLAKIRQGSLLVAYAKHGF